MGKFIQSFKKVNRSYGVVLGIATGFIVGIFFQSFSGTSKTWARSLSSNVSAAAPAATVCGLSAMPANDAIRGSVVSANEYTTASAAYQSANPDNPVGSATWGGIIGKEYLIAVINSLPATETNVHFRYATEANQKTSIYFKGGTVNPVSGKAETTVIAVKTGTSADTYCPTHCD